MNNTERVYCVVRQIPVGRVLTYGMIARLSGVENPRLVGSLLHKNPDSKNIPCHRVVNVQGKLAEKFAFGGAKMQSKRLTKEGVEVRNGKVDLTKYMWRGR